MGLTRITILLTLGSTLLADSAETPRPRAEAGATVTVTAEATDVEVAKTPNPVKVLATKTLQESGAENLGQALPLLLPGQMQHYGGPGTGTNLYLGGGRARDVVILLDGIRITDPSSHSPSYSDFALEGIERVEVLQGPASTRYGSDTHGGAIALYSAGPGAQGFSGTASLAAGNRGIRNASLAPAFAWAGGWLKAGFSASQEEQSIPADEPFRTVTGSLNLGLLLPEEGLLTFTYQNHHRSTPLPFAGDYLPPTWAFTPVFDPARSNSQRDQTLIGSFRKALGQAWFLETSLGHVVKDRLEPSMTLGGPEDHYRGQRNQAVGSLTWSPVDRFHASLMLDLQRDSAGIDGDRTAGSHEAAALELSQEWAFGLRAVASGRYQKDAIDYTFTSGLRLPKRRSHRFVHKAGLNQLFQNGFRVFASYGTSYNTPDLFSLTHNLANGHGDLENELSHGGQLGLGLDREAWHLKLEASRTLYDRVINYVDLGYPNFKYENGTHLRVQGIEASIAYEVEAWRLETFARSQEARNMSQPEPLQLTTSGAAGRPFFTGGLRGALSFGQWKLSGRWSYTGSSYQYISELGKVEGLHTHFNDLALALAWMPIAPVAITLRGEHLLQRAWSREAWLAGRINGEDDAYLLPGFPAQGPTYSLGVKYSF